MKNKLLIFLLLISSGALAQNRMYNLTTQFDSVKVRKLLMTSILEGGANDSVLVKKANGGLFKVARSSFGGGGGSGTVTSFGKVDGFGIISSVANPTTTPVLTIRTDTTQVRSVLNSYTKAQVDAKLTNYVDLTTNQTAAGNKTWTGDIQTFAGLGARFDQNAYFKQRSSVNQITGYGVISHTGDNYWGFFSQSGTSRTLYLVPPASGASYAQFRADGNSITPKIVAWTSDLPQTVEIAGTSQAMEAGRVYILHNAALTTMTLPATASVGDLIQIIGEGGFFRVAQNANQFIAFGNAQTTTGTTGYIQTNSNNTFISLRYVNTNKWLISSSNSTPTVF